MNSPKVCLRKLHAILAFGVALCIFSSPVDAVADLTIEVRPPGILIIPPETASEIEVIVRNNGPDTATNVGVRTSDTLVFPIGYIRFLVAASQPACDFQTTDLISPDGQITLLYSFTIGSMPTNSEYRCFLGVQGLWRQRDNFTMRSGAFDIGPGAFDPDFDNSVVSKRFLARSPIALPLDAPALLGLLLGVVGTGLWQVRQRINA